MVTDNYWFENALLKVNQECLNKILKDDDILVLQQYFVCLQSLTLIAGEKRQCDYWSSVLKKIKISSWTVICKHLSSDDLDKENALSIVDIMCSNYVELILGITRYLSNLNVESVLRQCTTYSSFDQCDIQCVPYLNGEMCKKLFTQISAELSIENKKLTANWYIQQIVAKEIYQYIGIVIGTIEFSIKEVYEIGIQLNTQMLLDDFCRSYSIEFSVDKNRQCFYDISPVGDTLKSILSSQQPWKFKNIMDDLLSHMTANLIQYGRFFAEIVLLTDCNNIIMGISFVPIHPIVSIVGRKNTYFISHRKQNDVKLYNIRNDRLITFDLHEIGCSRKIFTKALKKINKRDITEITNIILDKNLKFDLTKYTQSEEYQLLKNTKEIYWYGRNNHNQFMDDFYLLWRTAKFKEFKREILDYLLRKINTALLPYRNIANFSGEIITHCKESNYSQDFDRLQKGDLTISQFSNKLYHSK